MEDKKRPLPKWYDDAKLGIFIHWGIYSVPAFAPNTGELGVIQPDEYWFSHNPYAEWYKNSYMVGHGPTYEHHKEVYGDKKYEEFAEDFTCENFDPDAWMDLIKRSHARYFVLTTKHHDGYCLWDSATTEFKATGVGPHRDLVKELCAAADRKGIRRGLYYSGLLDWSYEYVPARNNDEAFKPANDTPAYAKIARKQIEEIIDTYKPDVLLNDMGWPTYGLDELPDIIAHYYDVVPHGVINDRWTLPIHDYTTHEYQYGVMSLTEKWEQQRGLGYSFGYNAYEDPKCVMSSDELIKLLVSTVAQNGNLLLNIGPKKDGTISDIQMERLNDLGAWLDINGEAIFDTRPCEPICTESEDGTIWYTQNDEYEYHLYTGYTREFDLEDGLEPLDERLEKHVIPNSICMAFKKRKS